MRDAGAKGKGGDVICSSGAPFDYMECISSWHDLLAVILLQAQKKWEATSGFVVAFIKLLRTQNT